MSNHNWFPENHPSNTILFKSICSTYEKFIASPQAVEAIAEISVSVSKTEDWKKETYRLLFRHYKNWEIAFLNIDDFLDSLWEKIEINAPNYFEQKFRYDKLLSMTDEELLSQGKNINNYVDNNNTEIDNPLKDPLKNIATQNSSQNFGDFSGRLRAQIRNSKLALINEFVGHFKRLFLFAGQSSEICDLT